MLVRRRAVLGSMVALVTPALILRSAFARPLAQAAPTLTLPDRPVQQGGSFLAVTSAPDASEVTLTFAGRAYPAGLDGGGWLAILGAGQRVGTSQQLAPGRYPVTARARWEDGTERTATGAVQVVATRYPVEEIWLAPEESALLDPGYTEREVAITIPIYARFTPTRRWSGFFLRPTTGAITDVFGSQRSYNGGPPGGSHSGVDFGADTGTPIRAAAAGTVVLARPLPVRGNAVIIDHGLGVFTTYCHMSAFRVAEEQDVRAGDLIGLVGATGLVTGPHLHWEVEVGGSQVNGMGWLNE